MTRTRTACIVCAGEDLVSLAELPSVPALCNQLLNDAAAARMVTRAAINLVGCRSCGHMFNAAFDPTLIDYDATYENSLLGSPRYRQYTDEIVDGIGRACGTAKASVVEIGCGRGEFLDLLCDHGFETCIGFDPSRSDECTVVGDRTVSIIGSVFDPARAPKADLVCSRHVLEHLSDPVDLLRVVRGAYEASPPSLVFLEVPNGRFTLTSLGIWDLIYEHVSYFTESSLSAALTRSALIPTAVRTTFGDQFLIAEARFAHDERKLGTVLPPDDLLHDLETFRTRFNTMVGAWEQWLARATASHCKLALWGGGSKGVTFLNLLDDDRRAIAYVIDSNPLKHGAFVAGTGHAIRSPSTVTRDRPDAVLLMNPEYETEVRRALRDLGEDVDIIVVSGRPPPAFEPGRHRRTAMPVA
jgi:SAM-dependent methyltransferase